jgi:triphosphatase
MASELELKLEVPAAKLRALEKSRWFHQLGASARQKLVSVYYDTASRALNEKHLSLRVRRIGPRHIQTIKAEAARALDRQEWERDIDGSVRDLARATALEPFAARKCWRKLRPVFETEITRTALETRHGKSRIEIALDHGRIKAGTRTRPVSEVELELKDGDARDLLALAQDLAGRLPAALGLQSKAERGYALADGTEEDCTGARNIPLAPELSTAEGFRAIALACLAHLAGNKQAILNGDGEGVHQMRVGLRRLRAALSLFQTLIEGPQTGRVKRDLKWLTEQLAPARDFEVFKDETVAPLHKAHPGNTGLTVLEREIAHRRDTGLAAAQRLMKSDRYRAVLLKTGLWALGGDWLRSSGDLRKARRDRPLKDSAADILTSRTRKVTKKLKTLDGMDDRARHKLRIAVKKLRYATGFFESLFTGHTKQQARFVKGLQALQGALGRLNDIRMHRQFARTTLRGHFPKAIKRAYGLGIVTGREDADTKACLKAALKAGRKFAGAKPYW